MIDTLVLKIGSSCNLNCKYCHNKSVPITWNGDILTYLQPSNITKITFMGGEPLLHFDIMQKIVDTFGSRFKYKLVTNGSLLDQEKLEYLNSNNIHCGVSYDGENESRDTTANINWRLVSMLNNVGLAMLFSPNNNNLDKLATDRNMLIQRYNLELPINSTFWLNFPHQTTVNPNTCVTKDLAKEYCLIIGRFLELDFLTKNIDTSSVISIAFNTFIRKRNVRGVRCCNENKVSLAINGDFLLCPYDDIVVGNIYDGIDWDKVESYIPERCKGCPLWESCMNTCIANITENECYIAKVLHKHFYKLMEKYGYTYEQLEELIKE